MSDEMKIRVSLLSLRLGIAAVFLAWTIDRIFNYAHNSGMIVGYYNIQISEPVLMVMDIVELLLVLAFLAGKFKTYTYGFILIAHTATTIASSWQLLPPLWETSIIVFWFATYARCLHWTFFTAR